MFKDFRDYLGRLEKHGMLVRVKKEVDIKFEIAAGIRKISDTEGPALLFENVKGFSGWRVAGGLYATPKLMAFALQTEENEDKMLERYLEIEKQRIKPVLVSNGPVKEVIVKGGDVDLTKLPIPTYCEHDASPYLTAGVEIARHPVTGAQNVSINRRMLLGKDKTGLDVGKLTDLDKIILAAEEQGQGLGVATVMGVHPAITIASQVQAPTGVDEMEIAGALRGKPFEVVKCETIDALVPAEAEVVIEGVTVPGEKVMDGPFGEFPGNYISLNNYYIGPTGALAHEAYVVQVTAITMRKDPIFQALLTGKPTTENQLLKKWALAAAMRHTVARVVPYAEDIRGINMTAGGACTHHVVVSVRKRKEATPRNIIYSILGMSFQAIGRVVVVDDDINVYDPIEVEWALATRVRPDRDIIVLPSAEAAPEAAQNAPTYTYRWGIDATAPLTKEPWLYKRAVPPGVNKVDYV